MHDKIYLKKTETEPRKGYRKMKEPKNEATREVTGKELREIVNSLSDDEAVTVIFGDENEHSWMESQKDLKRQEA